MVEVKDGKVIHESNTVITRSCTLRQREDSGLRKQLRVCGQRLRPSQQHLYRHLEGRESDCSARSQYAVRKFDRETGEILRILGGDS